MPSGARSRSAPAARDRASQATLSKRRDLRRTRILPLLVASLVLAATLGIGRVWRRRRRRRREDARPDDRRHRAADRRPVGLRAAGPQGRGPGRRADQRGGQGGRRRPHRQDRARGRPDRPAGRRAGGAQAGRRGTRPASRARGRRVDTIPIARSVTIREGVLQISPASTADEITRPRGRRADRTARRRRTASRARRWPTSWRRAWAARRARRSTSAPATTPTAPAWPTRSPRPWEAKGGKIGEQVIYDPKQPSYNSEAAEDRRPATPTAG